MPVNMTRIHGYIISFVLSLALCTAVLGESVIVPGAPWVDSSGEVIQAHGAGIMTVRALADSTMHRLTLERSTIHFTGLGKIRQQTVHFSPQYLATPSVHDLNICHQTY